MPDASRPQPSAEIVLDWQGHADTQDRAGLIVKLVEQKIAARQYEIAANTLVERLDGSEGRWLFCNFDDLSWVI